MNSVQRAAGWQLADVPFGTIERAAVCERDDLFMLVCAASFIESGSDLYAGNLAELFEGDAPVCDWLRNDWEREELQHGRALRAYVEHVWPEFRWEDAFAGFLDEYARLCTLDQLEPTRAQELVARCMVEMGTTTSYQALQSVAPEPVLRELTGRIRADEVRHYKHFHEYFLRYREQEHTHRSQVLATLVRRIAELRHSDIEIGLRHAARWRFDGGRTPEAIAARMHDMIALMRAKYPVDLAVRMAIQPLELPPRWRPWIARPLAALARSAWLH